MESVAFLDFPYELILRLLAASLFGAVIGIERDIHGRAAGLRTNLLVSLGSALFMIISIYTGTIIQDKEYFSILRIDPGRIAAQIVTGIGFLGAGTIIKEGFSIRGLTTAACMWIVAGIGMAAGSGFYLLALTATVISLISLIFLNIFERHYAKDSYRIMEITTNLDSDLASITKLLKGKYLKVLHCDFEQDYDNNLMIIKYHFRAHIKGITDKLSSKLLSDLHNSDISIKSIKWYHI